LTFVVRTILNETGSFDHDVGVLVTVSKDVGARLQSFNLAKIMRNLNFSGCKQGGHHGGLVTVVVAMVVLAIMMAMVVITSFELANMIIIF